MSMISSSKLEPGLIYVNYQWNCKKQLKFLKSFVLKGGSVKYVLKGRAKWVFKHIVHMDFQLRKQAIKTSEEAAMSEDCSIREKLLAAWLSFDSNPRLDHYLFETANSTFTNSKIAFEKEVNTGNNVEFYIFLDFGHDISVCDTIITVEDHSIPVNSSSLCQTSPVFNAMFHHRMTESITKNVLIEDIEYDTAKMLLLYIYRGRIVPCVPEVNFETFCLLYSAADKYDIPCLKKECLARLRCNLSEENVVELLRWARFHCITSLYHSALNFIADKSTAVFSTPDWKELVTELPDMSAEVHEYVARRRGVTDFDFF